MTLVEWDGFCIWNSFDTTASRIAPQATNTSKGILEVNRYIDEALLLTRWLPDLFSKI